MKDFEILLKLMSSNQTKKTVNLSDYKFTKKQVIEFIHRLATNTSIKELIVEKLKIGDALFEKFCKALEINKTLKSLVFKNNKMSFENAKSLSKMLKKNQELTSLMLHDNGFDSKSTTIICHAVSEHDKLECFEICDEATNSECFNDLSVVLSENENLNTLGLKFGGFKEEHNGALEKFCKALKANNKITSLKFFCSIDLVGIKKLSQALKEHPTLTSVNLYCKHFDMDRNPSDMEGIESIAEILDEKSKFISFDFNISRIWSEGAEVICKVLGRNTTLTWLNISNGHMAEEGAEYIAKLLSENKSLKFLNIAGNHFESEGLKSICGALEANTSVTSLDIGGNNPSVGRYYVGQMLKKNKSLKHLSINYENIEAPCVQEIFESQGENGSLISFEFIVCSLFADETKSISALLEKNPPLERLVLSEGFDSENSDMPFDIKPICAALKINNRLIFLDLSKCRLGPEQAPIICDFLKVNKGLRALSLRNNDFGPKGISELHETLIHNETLMSFSPPYCKFSRYAGGVDLESSKLHGSAKNINKKFVSIAKGYIDLSYQFQIHRETFGLSQIEEYLKKCNFHISCLKKEGYLIDSKCTKYLRGILFSNQGKISQDQMYFETFCELDRKLTLLEMDEKRIKEELKNFTKTLDLIDEMLKKIKDESLTLKNFDKMVNEYCANLNNLIFKASNHRISMHIHQLSFKRYHYQFLIQFGQACVERNAMNFKLILLMGSKKHLKSSSQADIYKYLFKSDLYDKHLVNEIFAFLIPKVSESVSEERYMRELKDESDCFEDLFDSDEQFFSTENEKKSDAEGAPWVGSIPVSASNGDADATTLTTGETGKGLKRKPDDETDLNEESGKRAKTENGSKPTKPLTPLLSQYRAAPTVGAGAGSGSGSGSGCGSSFTMSIGASGSSSSSISSTSADQDGDVQMKVKSGASFKSREI